jgi:hypothetical protein
VQTASHRRFCLTSGHLFYILTLSASAVSLFHWWGLAIASLVALVWWQVLSGAARESLGGTSDGSLELGAPRLSGDRVAAKRSAISRLELVVVLLLVGLLVGLMLPERPDADPLRQATGALRLVARALEDYRDDCGVYPPFVERVDLRQPVHSWRALVLPYLGESPLAAAYNLDEPWDGPRNRCLASCQPWAYRDFSQRGEGYQTTVQVLEFEGRPVLVEHEAWRSEWLEPGQMLSIDALSEFAKLPAGEEGFWRRGFFTSTFRGRPVAMQGCEIVVHPNGAGELEQTLKEQSCVGDGRSRSVVLGRATTVIHYQRGFQFILFVVIVLFPLLTLERLRGQ